ncbi:MAG TPA: LuxR C-terminal-related transcriptional regulator [Capillimicrobium sp.]
MTGRPPRVLVADHTGRLAATLAGCDVTVGAEPAEVLRLARALPAPDAVVAHAGFPPEGGVSLLTRLAPMRMPCVLVGAAADAATLHAALRVGVRGLVEPHATAESMHRAIASAVRGELLLGVELAGGLPALLDGDADAARPFPQLTDREHVALEQLAAGADPLRIAARLGVRPKTVRNMLAVVQAKLGVDDRAQAARAGRAAGLGGR